MGVSCGLQMLPDSDIDALILDPWLLYGFGPAWSRGDELTPLRSASLDKAWAGIQFLLTGTSTDDRDPLHYLCRAAWRSALPIRAENHECYGPLR
jgi:hypothetical protein